MPHPCRPYQLEAIRCTGKKLDTSQRVVLCMPTGSGKTRTCGEMVLRCSERAKSSLWLAHRDELVAQGYGALEELGLAPGAISSDRSLERRPGLVQVASVQTLLARPGDMPENVDWIFADEAHHYGDAAEKWSAILTRYPRARVVGPTATPERGDGTGLAPMFQDIVQATDVPDLSIRRLTEMGVLVPCNIIRPRTFLKLLRNDDVNALAQEPVEAWMMHASGQQGFIFFQSVSEATLGAEKLNALGVVSRVISGKTPALERRAIIAGFKTGRIACLCNVYVLTEGFDATAATVCVLASNIGTAGGFLQRVGRALRSSPGKESCTLIDLPGVSWVHGKPADDRVWSLSGRASNLVVGRSCPVCGKPVEDWPCAVCGHVPSGDLFGAREGAGSVIVDEPLTMYRAKLLEKDDQRRASLESWVLGRVMKKQRPEWAQHRFREIYGVDVPNEWYVHAVVKALEHVRDSKIDPAIQSRRGAMHADQLSQRRLRVTRSAR